MPLVPRSQSHWALQPVQQHLEFLHGPGTPPEDLSEGSPEHVRTERSANLPTSTDQELRSGASEFNRRPRRTLAWRTPEEVFNQVIASTD